MSADLWLCYWLVAITIWGTAEEHLNLHEDIKLLVDVSSSLFRPPPRPLVAVLQSPKKKNDKKTGSSVR